ncbi:hypothetical protein ACTQV1_01005 [Paratractidigestivibacter faecalis]
MDDLGASMYAARALLSSKRHMENMAEVKGKRRYETRKEMS